jgi:hypothetical protein
MKTTKKVGAGKSGPCFHDQLAQLAFVFLPLGRIAFFVNPTPVNKQVVGDGVAATPLLVFCHENLLVLAV